MQDFFSNIDALTVSQLTKQIKQVLEQNFQEVSVIGEISNFKAHISGHWYFNLKDSNAVISCTMWKGFNNYVFFTPQDGMKVIISGKITVYPPRGSYQIEVRSMKPAGIGELQAAFEMLKRKLADEGLFDVDHKKPIPQFPMKIGIVTAKDGAAFQDLISVAERRYPIAELIIAPARVQGSGAAESIVRSLRLLNQQKGIDVIIVARGGGSIEDLWAFNEEIVAREIFASKIPVITGIGHEIDFTISDFVADLRAPTPSAAMEIATPNKDDLFVFIHEFSYNTSRKLVLLCSEKANQISLILSSYGFRFPYDLIKNRYQFLDSLILKIFNSIGSNQLKLKNKVELNTKIIESHSKQKILRRGYTLIKQNSAFIKRLEKLDFSKSAEIEFLDGRVEMVVKN